MKTKTRFDRNFTVVMLGVAMIGVVVGITGHFLK